MVSKLHQPLIPLAELFIKQYKVHSFESLPIDFIEKIVLWTNTVNNLTSLYIKSLIINLH